MEPTDPKQDAKNGEAPQQEKPEGDSPPDPGDVPGGMQYGGDPDHPQGE